MARNDRKKVSVKPVDKTLIKMNNTINDMLDGITSSFFGSNSQREKELKDINDELDSIIKYEMTNLTDFTGNEISTFLYKTLKERDSKFTTEMKNIEDMFNDKNESILQQLTERYKNKNYLYEDLDVICSYMYELQEAIDTMRDSIVTSDDVSQTISRTLKFKNSTDHDMKNNVSNIENMEKEYDLLMKIKNHIIPKALQKGSYYAYAIPYSELYKKYHEKNVKTKRKNTMESVITLESQTENIFNTSNNGTKKECKDYLKGIQIINDDIPLPVTEGIDVSQTLDFMSNDTTFQSIVKKNINEKKRNSTPFADGVSDKNADKDSDFSDIKKCYIKLIDPRKMIPVKVMDYVIGYYYIVEGDTSSIHSLFTNKSTFSGIADRTKTDKTSFLDNLTSAIVKSFDKKYLEENKDFKDLILNALMYNDLYEKNIKFQFIPEKYVTEFKVNTDDNDEGVTILKKSLMFSKLYIGLLLFKLLTIFDKSNDSKIYYIKQAGIDKEVVSKVQDVARKIKEKQMNVMELMNYNSMMSKIGSAKDLFIPVGRSGERNIEFDILAGQDVQLNTDIMEMLRTASISATGVPSVIMSYINEADYSRTLVMANSKYVGRVINLQMDFNKSITEFYRKIMYFSGAVTDVEDIQTFEFILSPPKSLNNMNMADFINNADQILQFLSETAIGRNADSDKENNTMKDAATREMARTLFPMLPWNVVDEAFEKAKLEVAQLPKADGQEEQY